MPEVRSLRAVAVGVGGFTPSTTTEVTRPLPTLPTEDELARAERLLDDAFNEIERLEWRTRGFSRLVEDDRAIPEVLPTSADVGRLYLFAHYLDRRAADFTVLSRAIVVALPLLGEMPANAELMREASVDGS